MCLANDQPTTSGSPLPRDFLFGVSTAGFQVEGGFNGPGEPANNWFEWESAGRVVPSGNAVGFWNRPEEALDRAAAIGCDSFRLGVEWARICPEEGSVDRSALDRYRKIVDACHERALVPLVTLHHFTHPDRLGVDFWLRPDSPSRFGAYAGIVADALAPSVRHWVTINEINVLALESWLLGTFPPGRVLAVGDVAVALDHLLAAHVLAYEAVHRARPDARVTTNNSCVSVYEYDRMLTDLLLSRGAGIRRREIPEWLDERRRLHDRLEPAWPPSAGAASDRPMQWRPAPSFADRWSNALETVLRRASSLLSPYPSGTGGHTARFGGGVPIGRALEAIYESPVERTLDVLSLDWYGPVASRHFRSPGHRTSGGRSLQPVRRLWDDPPEPDHLTRWLGDASALAPGLPVWIVENGMCSRVHNGRSYPRVDGWDRCRYLRRHLAAVMAAIDAGVPVEGYWHWSLVDNYEWGSYEPRFGLYGIDRNRGDIGARWMDTDALGDDSAGAYRRLITGLRDGDRSVLAGD
ncbi:MAG: family 1 glycosylhydrolase [Acidimicrobiales bacterium]